jgi:hypothetical protein
MADGLLKMVDVPKTGQKDPHIAGGNGIPITTDDRLLS